VVPVASLIGQSLVVIAGPLRSGLVATHVSSYTQLKQPLGSVPWRN